MPEDMRNMHVVNNQLQIVMLALERGRRLHPVPKGQLDAVRKELAELEEAYETKDPFQIASEAMDVAVCALRIIFDGDEGPNSPSLHGALIKEIESLKLQNDSLRAKLGAGGH